MRLDLFGVVGDPEDGFTPSSVAEALRDHRGPLTVRINSPGGLAYDGVAIYNMLRPLRPRVEVLGIAASAASVVAMAGETVHVARGGELMIHDAWSLSIGNASAHESEAAGLRRLSSSISSIYASKSGRPKAEFLRLMAAETYLSGREAFELGLADSYAEQAETARTMQRAANRFEQRLAELGRPTRPAEARKRKAAFMQGRLRRLRERAA